MFNNIGLPGLLMVALLAYGIFVFLRWLYRR